MSRSPPTLSQAPLLEEAMIWVGMDRGWTASSSRGHQGDVYLGDKFWSLLPARRQNRHKRAFLVLEETPEHLDPR